MAYTDRAVTLASGNTVLGTDGSLVLDTGGGAGYLQLREQSSAPGAPGADRARLYCEDNGAGKTKLMVRFPTGAAVQLAIEP